MEIWNKGGIAVSRMVKILGLLLALMMLLPWAAVGEELTQLYLSRTDGGDYAAYLHAQGGRTAVPEAVVLYEWYMPTEGEGRQRTACSPCPAASSTVIEVGLQPD